MGGDDYNYYFLILPLLFSSSKFRIINDNFRVVVPQVQRQRLNHWPNLQRNIGDKYVVEASENNQIDVLITGTNKKIRINVKPPVKVVVIQPSIRQHLILR